MMVPFALHGMPFSLILLHTKSASRAMKSESDIFWLEVQKNKRETLESKLTSKKIVRRILCDPTIFASLRGILLLLGFVSTHIEVLHGYHIGWQRQLNTVGHSVQLTIYLCVKASFHPNETHFHIAGFARRNSF